MKDDQIITDSLTGRRRLTTIVATDVCDYSKLSEDNETAAIEGADAVFELCTKYADEFGGRVFSRMADGFLTEFPSTLNGARFAVIIRDEILKLGFESRTGIHVGDVIDRPGGDILGHGVNIAARLQQMADRNMVQASSNVINLLPDNINFEIKKSGKLSLKNIDKPINAFTISPKPKPSIWARIRASMTREKATVLVLASLLGCCAIWYVNFQQSQSVEQVMKANKLAPVALNDGGASAQITSSGLTANYIQNVLTSLKNSDIPNDAAAYALLTEGRLDDAVIKLINVSDALSVSDPRLIEVFHQLAALTHYAQPKKALSFYESILDIDENNKAALIWKFRVENLLSNPEKAQRSYDELIMRADLSTRERLLLTLSYAFTFSAMHDFDQSLEILRGIEKDIESLGDPRLHAYWETELSIVYLYKSELEFAEALAISVIKTLEKLGADTNLPRAHNIRGMILESRAAKTVVNKERLLNTAFSHFEDQYSSALKINKIVDVIEGLDSMARIHIKRNEVDLAHKKYLKSLQLAREHQHFLSEIDSLLGLAETNQSRGNMEKGCSYVDEVKALFLSGTERAVKMSGNMKARIDGLSCKDL